MGEIGQNESFKCPKCGTTTWGFLKFCPECGESLNRECPKCGATWRYFYEYPYCPECGAKTSGGLVKGKEGEKSKKFKDFDEETLQEIDKELRGSRKLQRPKPFIRW